MGVPCKDCLLELIEAGISEIVCIQETYYDELSKDILKEWIDTGGKFRRVVGV
jgi:deoxycytidylate deaminase